MEILPTFRPQTRGFMQIFVTFARNYLFFGFAIDNWMGLNPHPYVFLLPYFC